MIRSLLLVVRLLFVLSPVLLCACAALDRAIFFAEDKLLGANGNAVNGIKIRAVGNDFELRSAGIVRGNSNAQRNVPNWVEFGRVDLDGLVQVVIAGDDGDREVIESFLDLQLGDCSSPRRQLGEDLNLVAPLLRDLTAGSRLPLVELRLSTARDAIKYYELSRAASIDRLAMYLMQPLPPKQNCIWTRFWSAQMVEVIVHELVHIHVFQAFGDADRISNEVAAYGSELCVQLRLRGALPARRTYGPDGTNSDSLDDVMGWVRAGRMSTSMAGNFLSDRLRRLTMGDRALGVEDIPRLDGFCKRLVEKMVNVESAADISYVIQR